MIIKQIKTLSNALWESVKTDLGFFSPIQSFTKELAEQSYTSVADIDESLFYIKEIESFFVRYEKKEGSSFLYYAPRLIALNEGTVNQIMQLLQRLKELPTDELNNEYNSGKKANENSIAVNNAETIFIGHGRSKIWARVQVFLSDELKLNVLTYESESRVSEPIVNILEEFLQAASFAILIMTAEDEAANGTIRARQNVIHEAGLFQGKLGFEKVIILKQDTVDAFTNIAGLQYIPFSGDDIEVTFFELQKKLRKLNLLK